MSKIGRQNPGDKEINYVRALSRPSTIEAYSKWDVLSGIESLLVKLYINEDSKILDLGCGTGRIPKAVVVNSKQYIGVDCSTEMIQAAKRINPNFKFICEDILELKLKEKEFDIVLLMNNVIDMLHPYERREMVFNKIKKYLAPTGTLIFSSHLLSQGSRAGYYEENYHGVNVETYRSTFFQICQEIETNGFEIKLAARDYRLQLADWAYIAATVKLDY